MLRKLEAVLLPAGSSAEDISLIADLLGVPTGELYQKLDLSPQAKKQKTFEALTRRVVALARQRQPLLVVVEDVHWADPSSLELLDSMIGLLSDLPVLLIVTYRAEFAPPWAERANATLVTLNRLNHHDAERLATEVMIGYALPQALLERIVTQGDGVPLFIEELTKSLLENAESYERPSPSLTVPETLQAFLTARLDRLPAAKRVAQVAAAIGREFSQSLLAAVAQIPEKQLVDGLDQLIGSGLVSAAASWRMPYMHSSMRWCRKRFMTACCAGGGQKFMPGSSRLRRARSHSEQQSLACLDIIVRRPDCLPRLLPIIELPAAVLPNVPRSPRPEPICSVDCRLRQDYRTAPIVIAWKQNC